MVTLCKPVTADNLLFSIKVEQSCIDALCLRALLERARKGAMLAPLATLFMGWLVYETASPWLVVSWMVLNSLPDAVNFFLTSRWLKNPPPEHNLRSCHHGQLLIRTLQGFVWGSAAILFHAQNANALVSDLSILVVLITVSAITMVNTAPSFRSLAGFSMGILLLPAVFYFWLGDSQHVMFGTGLVMLWLVELETGRDVFAQFARGVRWGVINQEISQQLELRNAQLDEVNQELNTLAIHDELTGLYNRHFITGQLAQQMDLFERYNTACTLVMIDIDHFKQVNDRHGHVAGDNVLVAFSRRIEAQLRQGDIFARYGGEEFMLVLPVTEQEAAVRLAQRLCADVASLPLVRQPVILQITASFGVAHIRHGDTLKDWLGRADHALYKAKQSGRNCVKV